jgi:hypothetical protein
LAPVGVALFKVPEPGLAAVAATSVDVTLAVAHPGDHAVRRVGLWVADAVVAGSSRIAVARCEGQINDT